MPNAEKSRSGPRKGASQAERIRGLGSKMHNRFWGLAEDGSDADAQVIGIGAVDLCKPLARSSSALPRFANTWHQR